MHSFMHWSIDIMSKTFKNLLAISIAILPVNGIMIWYRLTQTENFSTSDMIVYPLLFGGGISLLILLLNKYLIKDSFQETFNSGKGNWYGDIHGRYRLDRHLFHHVLYRKSYFVQMDPQP